MNCKSLIVVAGMSRGGTNLLWNIIQSHPAIIDSYYELNEILGKKSNISIYDKILIEIEVLSGISIPLSREILSSRISAFSKFSFENDIYNREKSPDVPYKDAELQSLRVCTKLVSAWESNWLRKILRRNDALKYIPVLEKTYSKLHIFFLVRNGLAVAEGWGRRGADIETAARWYRKYVLSYERYVALNPTRATIIRFEDLLADPFKSAADISDFLGLARDKDAPLRIAIKPTIRSNQDVINTTEKKKVWIARDNFKEYLDTGINDAQIAKLGPAKRSVFIERNRDLLERYRYL